MISTRHTQAIHDAQMDHYGIRIATCSSDEHIHIYSKADGFRQPVVLHGHHGPVWMVSWAHPRFGTFLLSCGYDRKVNVWQMVKNAYRIVYCYQDHRASVNAIAWAPHEFGLMFAAVSSDDSISIHRLNGDIPSDKSHWNHHRIETSAGGCTCVSWCPYLPVQVLDSSTEEQKLESACLAVGGCDKVVRIWRYNLNSKSWNLDNNSPTCNFTDWVRDVSWAPALGSSFVTLAACSQAGELCIMKYDIKSQTWSTDSVSHEKLDQPIWRLSWSPLGQVLAASSGDSTVTLWREDVKGAWQTVQTISEPVQAKPATPKKTKSTPFKAPVSTSGTSGTGFPSPNQSFPGSFNPTGAPFTPPSMNPTSGINSSQSFSPAPAPFGGQFNPTSFPSNSPANVPPSIAPHPYTPDTTGVPPQFGTSSATSAPPSQFGNQFNPSINPPGPTGVTNGGPPSFGNQFNPSVNPPGPFPPVGTTGSVGATGAISAAPPSFGTQFNPTPFTPPSMNPMNPMNPVNPPNSMNPMNPMNPPNAMNPINPMNPSNSTSLNSAPNQPFSPNSFNPSTPFNPPPTAFNPPTTFNPPPTAFNPPGSFNSPSAFNPPGSFNSPSSFNPPGSFNPPNK